jgi:hypothetical protein
LNRAELGIGACRDEAQESMDQSSTSSFMAAHTRRRYMLATGTTTSGETERETAGKEEELTTRMRSCSGKLEEDQRGWISPET